MKLGGVFHLPLIDICFPLRDIREEQLVQCALLNVENRSFYAKSCELIFIKR